MKLTQMWPRKTLDPMDLQALCDGKPLPVTIEKIDYKTVDGDKPGDVEIVYYIKFRELAKPTKLSKTFADQIAACLGNDDTDHWTGRVIAIYPTKILVPAPDGSGRKVPIPVINCDMMAPRETPTLQPNTDITGLQFEVAPPAAGQLPPRRPPFNGAHAPGAMGAAANTPAVNPNAVLGDDKAARMIVVLKQRGKTWDDFVDHCRKNQMGQLIDGRLPPDAALAVVGPFNAYKQGFQRVVEVPDVEGEVARLKATWKPPAGPTSAGPRKLVMNAATGELMPDAEPDDDIPF
jgi:hypothetical protein